MLSTRTTKKNQLGVSIGGMVFVLFILALAGLMAAKIIPAFTEFSAIKKAAEVAKGAGSVAEIQLSFDKQKLVNGVEAIGGHDLEILKNGNEVTINFAYQKKIPLFNKVALLIDFAGGVGPGAQ